MWKEITDAFNKVIGWLDSAAITIGTTHLSLLVAIKGVVVIGLLIWGAIFLARLVHGRISKLRYLSPSVQTLLSTLVRTALLFTAITVGLNTVGIDLTVFNIFTGAVGVGVGLGLQKIVANFVSGIVLLLERSIKPGDVIEVGGTGQGVNDGSASTYGRVIHLGGRCTSVRTRDGKEYLIPNENLITNRVINWSYSNPQIRVLLAFGVAYNTDLRLAQELAIDAAASVDRVLAYPPPVCHVVEFAASSINFSLRFWIDDPGNGITNLKSNVFLALWDRLQEHQIEIPFPQHDLRIRHETTAVELADLDHGL